MFKAASWVTSELDHICAKGDVIWKHSGPLGIWSTAAPCLPPADFVVSITASTFTAWFIISSRSVFQVFPLRAQMITCKVSQTCELGIIAAIEISLSLRKLRQQEGKGKIAMKQGTKSTCGLSGNFCKERGTDVNSAKPPCAAMWPALCSLD